MRICFVLFAAASVFAEDKRLAAVDFFGYAAEDPLDEIRKSLPFQPGDLVTAERIDAWKAAARKAASAVTKRQATDVALICCDGDEWVAYIGLGNSPKPDYRAAATGKIRLAEEVIRFNRELDDLWMKNVMAGAKGDGGTLQRKLDALRVLAAKHERALVEAVDKSPDREHRAVAAFSIGHGLPPSAARVAVLVAAARDRDNEVRNNAVRGLIDWAAMMPDLIDPAVFLQLVQSGIWSDRNKGSWALHSLAKKRDPKVLDAIRNDAGAIGGLKEIARWKWEGHAVAAREILELLK